MTIGNGEIGTIAGKVALVTGAARGQGRSHAVALAENGADIAICDAVAEVPTIPYELARAEELDETKRMVEDAGRRCVAAPVDVRDLDGLTDFVNGATHDLGRMDIVVANAGVFSCAPNSWEVTPEQWEVMIQINLTGVWHTCKATIPVILRSGEGGSITMTSSVNAFTGVPGTGHYTASKHALVGLMRTLAIELASQDVRVNTLHPTAVNTQMAVNDATQGALAAATAVGKDMSNMMPVELIEPEDVTAALLWLVSPAARYVTGIAFPVDAGFSLK